MPEAEFFLLVEELVLLGEVERLVPLEAKLLPDEEPEGLEVLVGAGDATLKLSDMKGKRPFKNTYYRQL